MILGIKPTHDGGVAVIDGDRLAFSIEKEKVGNNLRYSALESLAEVPALLDSEGLRLGDIHTFSIDGWRQGRLKRMPQIDVAPYHEGDVYYQETAPWQFPMRFLGTQLPMENVLYPAVSYTHLMGHVVGSYVMSPWAKAQEPAYVCVWDGGSTARLYYVHPNGAEPVRFLNTVHHLYGMIYGIMGYYAGPFKNPPERLADNMSPYMGRRDWPGKLMAYVALGTPHKGLVLELHSWYERGRQPEEYVHTAWQEHVLLRSAAKYAKQMGISDEDFLASVHHFLERLLVNTLTGLIPKGKNFIFTGGCALNIKWNSALRSTGHFGAMFVPPTPNDSGSAIGAAACANATLNHIWHLNWSPYAGPFPGPDQPMTAAWRKNPCSVRELGFELMNEPREPVVVIHGRAEIGPRALGHRSVLMMPTGAGGKDLLNRIKGREPWRPVAPICLESAAGRYFTPGTPDPYMLYDHALLPAQLGPLNNVAHLDGTARLQTVGPYDSEFVHELLKTLLQYGAAPVLCNTSANLNGSGFFPDVESARAWNMVNKIWSNDTLYTRTPR